MESNGMFDGLLAFGAVGVLIGLAVAVISIIAYVKIISKAGYSGWWILSILFAPLALIMFFVFAFSEWPVQRELKALKGQHPGQPPTYGKPMAQ